MLPNCEHEDCVECLELAEACDGLRLNNMVMLAQIAKKNFGFEYNSRSRSKSGYEYYPWGLHGAWDISRSWSRRGSGAWSSCMFIKNGEFKFS